MRLVLLFAVLAALFGGCVSVKNDRAIVPPPALISEVTAPLTIPVESTSCVNLKKGTASGSLYIYEYLFTGISATVWTSTLERAMHKGGLKKLHYAEYHMTSILGYITTFTVTAYGE